MSRKSENKYEKPVFILFAAVIRQKNKRIDISSNGRV